MTVHIYDDLPEARRTVLRRRRMVDPDDVPEPVLASIRRVFDEELTPEAAVARIVADVRQRGDEALRDWAARVDGVTLDDFEVPAEALAGAYAALPGDLAEALDLANERIRAFHACQPIPSWTTREMGGILGQRVVPLTRVGIYVPGGTAPLPSSLLMAVIPARVAGVDEVVVCTPPGRGDGRVADVVLAAAHVAGVDRLFGLGGAQAIAALAYGTETVPRVDKIAGAGGLFTTLAKRQVYGDVGLDGLYGPTETVVVADEAANPAWVAADLLAQAEHDVLATAILLTPSRSLAEAVQVEVAHQLEQLSRADIIAASLAGQGGIVLTPDLETAVRLADEFAPEHLCLSVREPEAWAGRIRNAGGLFLGEHSFEVLGDYVAGPSHIMPTGGTARFASPVNVFDFVKIVNVIGLDAETGARIGPAAACLAQAESLTAHGAAATARRSHRTQSQSWESQSRMGNADLSGFEGPTHPHLETIEPYEPPDLAAVAATAGLSVEQLIRLSANENPFGPAPSAVQALAEYPDYAFYPDYTPLREAVARYAEVRPEQVVLGNGADELIDLVVRLFVEPGQAVVVCPPTFEMYAFFALVNRCRVLPVPRGADFSLDVEAIQAEVRASQGSAQVLFLVSPGSPDGQAIPLGVIGKLLELPMLAVVDEAYIEFGGESAASLLPDHENLIVVRTFSKWAGMAGLRLGYALMAPRLARYLEQIRAPYNVNAASVAAALATLEDLETVRANVACLIAERERLQDALAAFSWLEPLPSQANFILCRVRGRVGQEVVGALAQRGILILGFSNPSMAGYVRLGVGLPWQNDALLDALREIDEERGDRLS